MNDLQKIYESQNSIIYKGKYLEFDEQVLIKTLNSKFINDKKIDCFDNEFEITKKLEIYGVRKALKNIKKNGKNILILEYFNGITLKKFFSKKKINFSKYLKIVSKISQIIGEIHNKNIIHKDINSNNILLNKNYEICIIDFGISTKYKLKNQYISNPENLEGTISYISPEQTGRMNRTVDYRSDLYSFGVVLYEMFTEKLPFDEKDNMEVLHSHIAEKPISPEKINNEIPKILSKIILKLLSKNAEDRYQSAFGLKHDIDKIRNENFLINNEELEIKDKNFNFKMGEKDFSGKLLIPEKLYGREEEIKKLFEIYENIIKGKKELLLIYGLSGVGKSAIIHEIHKTLTIKNGFYIEGKFEQFQKNIPYFAIIQAFTDFANIILKENDEKLNYWKNLIQNSVGNVGAVLTNLIPELELIIGKQKELPKLDEKENQNRFNYVWSNFIKAISNKNHPLIIFIDDLQWADNASIKILKLLINDNEIKYLFPIISYRDNEININDLKEFTKLKNINISKIKLENLKQKDINNLINDTLVNIKNFKNISSLIYSKTLGNPFFTVQFIKSLYEDEFLKFDFNENTWKWDFEEIEKQNITDNVVELMSKKIQKLPKNTQYILKIASCIGSRFDIKILSIIYKKNIEDSKKDLEAAILENFIFQINKENFKFVHDKIQQAFHSTIPDAERNNFHFQIGKLLLKFLNEENLQKKIFDVVNQLNYGKNLIKNKKEKKQFSELNFKCGLKAKHSSAYLPAYNYLKIAESFLEKNSWKKNYDFTLKIYDELTEISYLIAYLKKTEEYTKIINKNARNTLDKTNSYYSLINSYRSQSLFAKTIKTGLEILSEFGVSFPEKPSKLNVIFNLIKVSIKIKTLGYKKFVELPIIKNKKIEAQMRIIYSIGSSAFISRRDLVPLLILKGISMALNYGHSYSSPYFISAHGIILGTLNKIKSSREMGKISNEIQEKYNFRNIKCRTNFVNSSFIEIWKEKFHIVKNTFFEIYKIGLEVGDFEFAGSSIAAFFNLSIFSNNRLSQIKKKTLENLNQIKKLHYTSTLQRTLIGLQISYDLSNKNLEITKLYFDEKKAIPSLLKERDFVSLGIFYTMKIFYIYVFNDKNKMENAINKLLEYQGGVKGYYFYALANFYISLCSIEIYKNKGKKEKKNILKIIDKNQKQMKIWAKYCPENFQHKYDFVKAEKFRIIEKKDFVKNYYDKAIKNANKNQMLSEEAIFWEKAGNFYLEEKNTILAKTYFQNAYKVYKKWGAFAKLKQLEKKYQNFIFEKQDIETSSSKDKYASNSTMIGTSASLFDMESIVKANQSLSGEVKLEKLLKSILMIIMENAGADYAVIVKNNDKNFTIEAKGKYGFENIEVLQSENLENSKSVILNVIKYVIRTKKFVVIDDILKDGNYSNNDYVKNNAVKSVFCYPVIHKNKMLSILYLENSLSTNVFTSERIETIKILSSQIAVSIENALLYENLENKVNQRTKELKKAKEKIEISYKHTSDSINYAKKIQNAIFPDLQLFEENFAGYFIIFKPLDVVSGDFYWAKKVNKYLIFCAADCTGHGVPGAFVSMLGISFLNEIVTRENMKKASQILDVLREEIKKSLKQTMKSQNKDGMDIAMCILNTENKNLQFSGANNPLYLFRDDELIEFKANKQPIGVYPKEKKFENYEIQLKKGDKLYIFSDGYVDQFGGEKGKKFMKKRFKNLLLKIQKENMNEQKYILESKFKDWKGNLNQIDDVLVMGVKI